MSTPYAFTGMKQKFTPHQATVICGFSTKHTSLKY
jgi:hypothetical protein